MLKLKKHKTELPQTASGIPKPSPEESAVVYAQRLGEWFSARRPREYKKKFGQFFTSADIAQFMASLTVPVGSEIRILDPGAGCGILSCAVCEQIIRNPHHIKIIRLDLYETDPDLSLLLDKCMSHMSRILNRHSITLDYHIHTSDYILEHADALCSGSLLFNDAIAAYDVCISNPPYFKLSKSDRRAVAALSVIYGQPNIYALFMAVSAALLKKGGQLVFITPRSFASGFYFKRFRDYFFSLIRPELIHLFDSRRDGFKKDGVLQEMIILKGTRSDLWRQQKRQAAIQISVSYSPDDLKQAQTSVYDVNLLLDTRSGMNILRLPKNRDEERIVERVLTWPGSFGKYNLHISTGPVVAFRSRDFLLYGDTQPNEAVPLLWLHHIRSMKIQWPIHTLKKPQWLQLCNEAAKFCVRNQNLVLVRRFSAKEEERRLVAAPYLKSLLPVSHLGLENHLNYIYKREGTLTPQEAAGLAVLLNSKHLDTYFRVINGNTQVGATEISLIPLPPLETIIQAGQIALEAGFDGCNVEAIATLFFEQ